MKRLLTISIFLLTALPLLLARSAAYAETLPDQTAREVTDKILSLIKQNRDAYSKDYRKLYAMVDEVLLPLIDFRRVSQQVLGPTWRTASEEQRNKFTAEFRDLLVRTYATAMLKYNNEKIVYQPLKAAPGERTLVVKSTIHRTDGGPPISINYSFFKNKDAEWKIYDMAIEGPSVVTTYQRVYAERLHKEGLDPLIASMAQDNERARAGGAAK
jgi:phospholipid transport system substrate-binding protein